MAKERNNSATDPEEFIFTRVLDAPRQLVFRMLTESEHLARWWGPKGFKIRIAKLDLRPGGVFRFHMQSPDGRNDMWGKFVYREIVAPERLVYVVSFSDEQGNMLRHPLAISWPLEMLNTLTLSEYDGKTKLTMSGVPINATKEERKAFKEGHKSMQQGFAGTFEKFDEYSATLGKEMVAKNSSTEDLEIIITRIINAPRQLVFKAWTDPGQVGQWWGPRGFTTTAREMDVKDDKVYNIELPNGDAVRLCYTTDKDGPSLQIISSTWCEKTALDVQAKEENKRFGPYGKVLMHQPGMCNNADCSICGYLIRT